MLDKKIKYFTILFVLLFNCSYAQWYPQVANTTANLYSVFFINQSTGWACGLDIVLKTTDGGLTWTGISPPGNHKSIYFTDALTGWICGESGRLYKTTNGGQNWIQVNSGTSAILNQITFFNPNLGIIAGNQKTLLRTIDGGTTWTNVFSHSYLDFLSVKIIDANRFLVSGAESSIFTSTNSGYDWDSLTFGVPNALATIEFINENTGWVSGCCGMFMMTTDAGSNWSPEVYLTPGITIYSMKFVNENTGFAVADAGYILRTSNGGNNWDSVTSNTNTGLRSVCFVNNDTGFAVGMNGVILRTMNGGGEGHPLGVENNFNSIIEGYSLSQNYPNPFNPVTKINYSLPNTQYIMLKVYDVLGNEAAILVNERQNAGSHEVTFYGSNLSSGIYFYKLKAGKYELVKKMILLK